MSVKQEIVPGKRYGKNLTVQTQPWTGCIHIQCLTNPCEPRISGEKQCPALTLEEREIYNGRPKTTK